MRLQVNDAPVFIIGGRRAVSMLSAHLSEKNPPTVSLFDGTVDSDVFYAWIRQDLLPKLPECSVVVMDNASFHKRRDIQKVVEPQGICLNI